MHVIGGMNVRINQKDPPAKVNRDQHVSGRLKMVLGHPFAFYDITTQRTWLVDGVSALLHLVRISLHLDATDDESTYDEWVFNSAKLDERWNHCNGRSAALGILKSLELRNLPVYVERHSFVDGQLIKHFSTFGDRVDKILHLMEVLVDRERDLESCDGVRVPQTLSRQRQVTGFDIMDLTNQTRPIESRIAPLSQSGYGWSDIFPHLRVITIFGSDFGELIRPNECVHACRDWQTVPYGQDYMAVTTSTLKLLRERHIMALCSGLRDGELTDTTLWASSHPPLEPCGCLAGGVLQKHLDPIQFLYSKSPSIWHASRKQPKNAYPVDIARLDPAGALIFSNTGSPSRNHRNSSSLAVRRQTNLVSPASSSGGLGQRSSLSASASNTAHTDSSVNVLSSSASSATAPSTPNNMFSSMASGSAGISISTTLPSTANATGPGSIAINGIVSEDQQDSDGAGDTKKRKRRRTWAAKFMKG